METNWRKGWLVIIIIYIVSAVSWWSDLSIFAPKSYAETAKDIVWRSWWNTLTLKQTYRSRVEVCAISRDCAETAQRFELVSEMGATLSRHNIFCYKGVW